MNKNQLFIIFFLMFLLSFSLISFGLFIFFSGDTPAPKEIMSIDDLKNIYSLPTDPPVKPDENGKNTSDASINSNPPHPASVVVPAGYYAISSDSKQVRVTRTVSDEKSIRLISGTGLGMFGDSKIKNVAFVSDGTTNTSYAHFTGLSQNPIISDLSYKIEKSNSKYTIRFEKNVSGYLCYTVVSDTGGNMLSISDGAQHMSVSLPDSKRTGSYIFGRCIPSPDKTIERPEYSDMLLIWENVKSVTLQYYGKNVPLYMGVTTLVLLILTVIVLLNYAKNMIIARNIVNYVDPDGKSGFRDKKS